jgi:hypothetical protein
VYFDNVHCTGQKSKPVLDGFLKSEGQIPIGYQHKLYKRLLIDLQNIQRIAIGYINQLGSQKISIF